MVRNSSLPFGLLGVWVLAGCGGTAEPPPPPPPAPIGSLALSWSLVDETGATLECSELNLVETEVSIGGEPQRIPCGEPQTARFESLVAQRYPVVVRLLGIGGGVIRETFDNVVVTEGAPTEHNVTIEIDLGQTGTGRLKIDWFVAGRPASEGCAQVGAETIVFQTQANSIAQFEVIDDCNRGTALIENLRTGGYIVRAFLRDNTGATIPGSTREFDNLQIGPTEEVSRTLSFFVATESANFEGMWTISSSSAADACETLSATEVRVRLANDSPDGIEIATATAACSAGSLLMEDLSGGIGEVRATFFLSDFFGTQLASASVRNLLLPSAMTTTVSVDFQVIQ